MRNRLNIFLIFFFGSILISVFHRWFFQSEIVGGDWPYLFEESLENYHFLVPSWNAWQGNGLGGTNPIYFLQSFEYLTVSLANFLNIPWLFVYKIFWFGLFIALSIFSSIYLLRTISSSAKLWQMGVAALIFTTNTYILMVVGGGQMGIALAYSVAPLVLARFIKIIHNSSFIIHHSVIAGLALSLQVLFDPRIAGITMIAVAIYIALNIKKNILSSFILMLYALIIPALVAVLLHIFWILPLFTFSQDLYQRFGDSDTGIGIVKFLSFSAFSEGISLLHSSWPENIFGKVGFMKPEFLALPILAFSSLLFLINSTIKQFNPVKIASQFNGASNTTILFFVFLGLIGAFLAKGVNPPFGDFYLWLSENIPGFEMFRDSTKFYLLVSLSYSVLIPFSVNSIYNWLKSNIKYQKSNIHSKYKIFNFSYVFLIFTICYLIFLIRPAILGQLGGTFRNHEVPKEYVILKDFLYKQPEFFRTLWIPRQQRFTFFSNLHPSVEAGPLFNVTSAAESIRELKKTGIQEYLSELSVKYIIVPYDSLGEFFLTDRKYDKTIPEKISKSLDTIPFLKKIDGFGSIAIFEVPSPKDHFWLQKSGKISYKMLSPTNYSINVSLVNPQKIIFSEKYNLSWVAKVGNTTVKSQKTSSNLNSFALEKGDHDLEIVFLQDKVYGYGRVISLVTLLGILFFILKYRKSSSLSN